METAKINVIWDMETDDPDDFLTLLLLLGHPRVNLKAVTLIPGSVQQVGLVKKAFQWFGVHLPIGSYNIKLEKPAVSDWHYQAYGDIPSSNDAEPACELIAREATPDTTIITGGPLRNIENAINHAAKQQQEFQIAQIVVQGGFAGEGIVPREKQLDKFQGQQTAVSHNLSKHPRSVLAVLNHQGFQIRRFVSKNVCHKVVYDQQLHGQVKAVKDNSLSLNLIWQGMERFLQDLPTGKIIHDILAACCAIDPTIGSWAEVDIYQEKGAWGARLSSATNTHIIVDYDQEKFLSTFLS